VPCSTTRPTSMTTMRSSPNLSAPAADLAHLGQLVLTVKNTGPSVSAGEMERLFQPFARLDDGAGGLGLGLSAVRAVAAAHEANLTCRARAEGGLEVEVSFEACAQPGTVVLPSRAAPTSTAENNGAYSPCSRQP
jgi:signal transduction histidine kinase